MTHLINRVAATAARTLSICLPGQCAACSASISAQEAWQNRQNSLCNRCDQVLFAPSMVMCQQCALPLGPRLQAFGWTHCRHCRAAPKDLLSVAATRYQPPLDGLIQRLKYGGDTTLAKLFAQKIHQRWISMTQASALPDVWLPIPVSRQRIAERGYNQALLIARHLGRLTARPCQADWLVKTRHTTSQADLSEAARRRNLQDAFAVRDCVQGLRIGLVDDVMTTGATLNTVRDVLQAARAGPISYWIVARTPE